MSNSHSKLMKIAGLGSVGLLLGLDSATAIKVSQKSSVSAGLALTQQIQSLSQSVEQALMESGELASLMADSELRSLVSEEVHQAVTEELTAPSDQKTNLEEANSATPKHAKKHHKKHKHHKDSHSEAPKQTSNLAATTESLNIAIEQNSQPVTVPIDEVKAITLKVSPTYSRDIVESVTLKAFRKVIGYDTFTSILRKDRDEVKDSSDHYNITVSMMVRRDPELAILATNSSDPYSSTTSLTASLDKGFPYDDGDNSIDDASQMYAKHSVPDESMLLGKLNGENITSGALKNLVRDTEVPITQQLIQLESDISTSTSGDDDNVFKLMDSNVTKGQMKNLITDKPAPITVKLAQTETSGDADNVFKLMDSNVTKGQMKNLITDKPAPITVKLAQTDASGDADNVFKLMDSNVTKGQMKNLITDKPAPITVKLAQTGAENKDNGVPVYVNPTLMPPTGAETEDLPVNMTVGGSNVKAVQTQQLSQERKQAIKDQAQQMMTGVKAYCECQNHHLAQKKQDGETYETGDEVCTPVTDIAYGDVQGIDCNMDGYNVTTEALEGLLTDRESPITLPLDVANVTETEPAVEPALDESLAAMNKTTKEKIEKKVDYGTSWNSTNFSDKKKKESFAQVKGEGEDAPTEEELDKAEEEANSAKNVASAAINALATGELEKKGIVEKSAGNVKMEDPMHGKVVDIKMNVGGSTVDLTQATFDAQKAAKEKAKDDAVKKLAEEQDQQ